MEEIIAVLNAAGQEVFHGVLDADEVTLRVSIHGSRWSAWVVVRPGEGSLTCG
jgi:hypothetical protein